MELRETATLRLTYGTMAAGKSTLALQMVWQLREHSGQESGVALWTFGDRSLEGKVTSRLGISATAVSVKPEESLSSHVSALLDNGTRILVVDEAQFASLDQVDVLVSLVDDFGVTVHCFALATDFQAEVFPGTSKLFALADSVSELPLATYCWCGQKGRCNARVVGGFVVRDGKQIVLGDVGSGSDNVSYRVLCRKHYRLGQIGPAVVPTPEPSPELSSEPSQEAPVVAADKHKLFSLPVGKLGFWKTKSVRSEPRSR